MTTDNNSLVPAKPLNPLNPLTRKTVVQEKSLAKEVLGIAISEGFFANGQPLSPEAEHKEREIRKEFDELPSFEESAEALIETIQNEQRLDIVIQANKIRVDDNGILRGFPGETGIIASEHAWSQLAKFAPEGVPTGLGNNVNMWAKSSKRALNFRTRNPEGSYRQAFAVVTPNYQSFDLNKIASELVKHLPEDAKGETFYDGQGGEIIATLAPTYGDAEVGVGRISRLKLICTSDDIGTEKVRFSYAVEHLICGNGTRITDKKFIFERKHRGNNFDELIAEAFEAAGEALQAFSTLWKEASEKRILDKTTKSELAPLEIFRRLTSHGHVKLPWVKAPDMTQILMTAWEKEPGETAAHINQAISRAAWENAQEWRSPWHTRDMEEQAGQVLFGKLYSLPALTAEQEEAFADVA